MTGFRTLPKDKRPRALTLAALRKTRIGPIFPQDPDREIGMRGVPDPKGTKRRWTAYRARRRVLRNLAAASRRRNR